MACSSKDIQPQLDISANIVEDEKRVLKRYGPFKLQELDRLPEEYKGTKDKTAILTAWDMNCYIKMTDDEGHFEVTECLGTELSLDRDYLLMT